MKNVFARLALGGILGVAVLVILTVIAFARGAIQESHADQNSKEKISMNSGLVPKACTHQIEGSLTLTAAKVFFVARSVDQCAGGMSQVLLAQSGRTLDTQFKSRLQKQNYILTPEMAQYLMTVTEQVLKDGAHGFVFDHVMAHAEGSLRKLANASELSDLLKEKWNLEVAPSDVSAAPTIVTAENSAQTNL